MPAQFAAAEPKPMTYLPKPVIGAAGPLADADGIAVVQSGAVKNATLLILKNFVNGAAPVTAPLPVGPVASAEGTTVAGPGSAIVDSALKSYTLQPLAGQGFQIYINGVADAATNNVVLLLMHSGNCWQKNSLGQWYAYINGLSYSQPGDPRVATGPAAGPYTYPAGTSGPYGGIGDTGSGAGPQAYLYGRSLGDLFGTYTYPNPGGLDGGYTLKHNLDKLFSVSGVRPKTMNAFNDFQNDLNHVGAGTFAYGWASDVDAAEISGPNGYLRPIIGVKLGASAQGWDNPATYDAIVSGTYDSQYLTEVNAWISGGYKKLTFRYAYEFNGTFMPDYCGHNVADNQRFAAALRHVILLVKNRCIQAGVNARFSWNPTSINYGDTDIINAYPGDDVIDIIDTDIYNHAYPQDLTNWDANGNSLGTTAATGVEWLSRVENRRKYWNYPGCKSFAPNSSGGWSVLRAIELAKAKGKPIAFSECGTGGKGTDTSVALLNSPDWVIWFWQTLQSAISQGVVIEHINLWNIYAGDGQWEYSAPDTYDPQPLVTLAYRKYFGDGAFAGGPTPVGGTAPPATPVSVALKNLLPAGASNNFRSSAWTLDPGIIVTPAAGTALSGASMSRVQFPSPGLHMNAYGPAASGPAICSVNMKSNTGAAQTLNYYDDALNAQVALTINTTEQRFSFYSLVQGGQARFLLYSGTGVTADVLMSEAQIELGTTSTAYVGT
jgi:hypothetical protein